MTDYCGRFLGVPESYNGTEMVTCMQCGRTARTRETLAEGPCRRGGPE